MLGWIILAFCDVLASTQAAPSRLSGKVSDCQAKKPRGHRVRRFMIGDNFAEELRFTFLDAVFDQLAHSRTWLGRRLLPY